MKIFNLTEFNEDTLSKFIEFTNMYWEDEWCIFLNSNGGSTWIRAQIDEVLHRKVLHPTSCYLNVAKAYSSGFILMMNFKGHINILNDARGMIHQGADELTINISGKEVTIASTNYADMLKKHSKDVYKKDLIFCKTFMSEDQLEDYKNGKDIYYNEKQLLTFVKQKI